MYIDTDKLYEKIQALNKRGIVTMDSLFEGHGYSEINRITEGVQKLRGLGLLSIQTIRNHGRFETELVPKDGYVYHEPKRESKEVRKLKAKEQEGEPEIEIDSEELPKKEKAVIKVRRKA
jgi:hypothetical protein